MATTQTNTVTLTVTPSGPTITLQPVSQTVDEFTSAIFTVAATSSGGALTYQWYETSGGALAETTDTLTITGLASETGYGYYCNVTDDNGVTTSDTAVLTVTDVAAPVITLQPASVFPIDTEVVSFTVAATGVDPLTYQWREQTAGDLVGETGTTLTFAAAAADAGKNYYCRVTDVHLQFTDSNNALLTIVTPPTIQQNPVDTTVIEFRDATFTVTATGNAPFNYEWFSTANGSVKSGTENFYTFAPLLADSGDTFWVEVTDTYNHTSTSPLATLTVVDAQHPDTGVYLDADILGPDDVYVAYGQRAQFSIINLENLTVPPYTVDWYNDRDGLVLADGGNTFTYSPPVADQDLNWYVVVQDTDGDYGQSQLAKLTILPAILDLSWSIADAQLDTGILVYQSISWAVHDAYGDNEASNFPCPIRTHRGLTDEGETYWIPFYDKSARCSRGPLVNDLYNRYYWTQDGEGLRYSTLDNLMLDSKTTGLPVGIPSPEKPPKVKPAVSQSDNDIIVDRAYVFTYVSIYGEEGPPSPPRLKSGVEGGTWEIKTDNSPVPTNGARLGSKKIYRSVSTATGAEYHYVGSIPITVDIFFDSYSTADVGVNYVLESDGWEPPPEDLNGLITHPDGFFVGYSGRDIYMSVPFRPHAWPSEYVVSTTSDILGFGVYGNTIVVCTESHPYALTGINPAAMTFTKHDTAEPCVSRYGIVSMPFGVYYPGPNGLMLASSQGLVNATKKLMTKEEWQTRYQVTEFDAARYQGQYVAFYNPTRGIMFDPGEPMAALVDLDLTGAETQPDSMESIFTDEYSGRTYLFNGCDMYEWNPVSGAPLEYDWTSMEFDIADPANFGAARIIWYAPWTPPTPEETWAFRIRNTSRMAAAALNPFNFHAIGAVNRIEEDFYPELTYDLSVLDGVEDIDPTDVQAVLDAMDATPTKWQIKQPFSWSPMIWTPPIGERWPNTPYVIMQFIVNETVIYTKEVTHTKMFRLPPGFKGTRFRVRLRSNINIQSCKIGEVGKELRNI